MFSLIVHLLIQHRHPFFGNGIDWTGQRKRLVESDRY